MKRPIKNAVNYARVKEAAQGKLTAVASDPSIDRDGEIILATAFASHLDGYKANPVILAAHTHRGFEGTPTIIGSASKIAIEDDALLFEMGWAKTALAKEWQSLYEDGHAKAFSVGFIPIAGEMKEVNGQAAYVHTEVELLEISAVAVPANPAALARGMDSDELRALIDQRIKIALERMYVQRLTAIIG